MICTQLCTLQACMLFQTETSGCGKQATHTPMFLESPIKERTAVYIQVTVKKHLTVITEIVEGDALA